MARSNPAETSNDIEQFRKNRQKRHKRRRIVRALVIILILLLIGVLIFFASRIDFSDISEIVNPSTPSQADGEATGFPKKLFGERPLQFERSGSYLAMVTDGKLCLFNETGETVLSAPHSYTRPTMTCADGKVLLYDRGGNDFRVDSDRGTSMERELQNEIICGTLNSQGFAAVATTEDRYAGAVTVFNAQNREIFKWYSSDGQINGVTLRDDGVLAVCCIGARDGAILSTVYFMNISRGENQEVASAEFPDLMILSATFKENGALCLIGDTKAVSLSIDGKARSEYVYGKNIRDYSDVSGSGTALVLSSSVYAEEEEVVLLDNDMNALGAHSLQSDVKWTQISGLDVYVLCDGSILKFDSRMNSVREFPVRVDTTKFVVIGSNIYPLGLGEISLLS